MTVDKPMSDVVVVDGGSRLLKVIVIGASSLSVEGASKLREEWRETRHCLPSIDYALGIHPKAKATDPRPRVPTKDKERPPTSAKTYVA